MPTRETLGELELYVLAALARLGEDAYGVTIRREIETRARRATSIGAVYATLGRLADKGFVSFQFSDPLPVRGGRARKHALLTASGRRALRDSLRSLHGMVGDLGLGFSTETHS
jgi:DNA-binding PadR family transcriptional regulator